MQDARKITGWIFVSLCVGLTGAIGFWSAVDPAEFLRHDLDVNAQALRVPWAWALTVAVAAGYSFYTVRAVPFVGQYKFEFSLLTAPRRPIAVPPAPSTGAGVILSYTDVREDSYLGTG